MLHVARAIRAATFGTSPGKWRIGKMGGSLVTDTPAGPWHDGRDIEYYDGNLLAESIAKPSDALYMQMTQPTVVRVLCEAFEWLWEQQAVSHRRLVIDELEKLRDRIDNARCRNEQTLRAAAGDAVSELDLILNALKAQR